MLTATTVASAATPTVVLRVSSIARYTVNLFRIDSFELHSRWDYIGIYVQPYPIRASAIFLHLNVNEILLHTKYIYLLFRVYCHCCPSNAKRKLHNNRNCVYYHSLTVVHATINSHGATDHVIGNTVLCLSVAYLIEIGNELVSSMVNNSNNSTSKHFYHCDLHSSNWLFNSSCELKINGNTNERRKKRKEKEEEKKLQQKCDGRKWTTEMETCKIEMTKTIFACD